MTRLKDAVDFTYALLQGKPAALTAVGALTPAADKAPYYTSSSAAALMTITSFIRTLLDDTDAATARTTLSAVGIGQIGMIARAKLSAAQTVASGATDIINFDTVAHDPGSTITTGASWHFTSPVSAWYDLRFVNSYVDPNGSAYAAGTGVAIDVYKNTSSFMETIGYEESDGTGVATNHWLFPNGTVTVHLPAADTMCLKFNNFSGAARKLGTAAAIEIYRAYY